jgi:trehalose synthase
MADPDEAATIVNAMQRHATVVIQKSLAEGFGLTVAEAMWKGRPVIASAVGGIVNQIVPNDSGVLLHDPRDLDNFGQTLRTLLADRIERARMGTSAQLRVAEHFLADRHLEDWVALFAGLDRP